MRIAHYYAHQFHRESGVTVSLSQWSRAQQDVGHDVVWLNDGQGVTCSPEFPTITVRHTGSRRLTSAPIGLAKYVADFDLVYLHEGWTLSHLVAGRACRKAQTAYVLMPHGVYESGIRESLKPPRALRAGLERRLLEGALASHVFFPGEDRLVTDLAPSATTIIAPTGATLPPDTWRAGGDYVAWFGRYDPGHKGLDLLLQGLAAVAPDRRPQLRLRGYDYRGGKSVIMGMVNELALAPWVDVGDEIRGEDKLSFLLSASCYVHPSRWESHSVALLEVLGMGVPALVSSAIHIAPLLRDDGAAVLVDATVQAWAQALRELGGSGMPAGVGSRGRAFVANRLDWGIVMDRWRTQLTELGLPA